jgi:hypothetical protein
VLDERDRPAFLDVLGTVAEGLAQLDLQAVGSALRHAVEPDPPARHRFQHEHPDGGRSRVERGRERVVGIDSRAHVDLLRRTGGGEAGRPEQR